MVLFMSQAVQTKGVRQDLDLTHFVYLYSYRILRHTRPALAVEGFI